MNAEESWLTEIITSQKRTLALSVLFLTLTVACIPTGLLLLRSEPGWTTFDVDPASKPPVEVRDHSRSAFVVIAAGILLLLLAIYLWQFHTPAGVRHQLHDLQELMSATLETKRREYRLHLPDGPIVTVKYTPYRWAARELCGFQLRVLPLATWTDTMQHEALRGGFSINHANVLRTNCSLEEFFPRTLLLYTIIQRIQQFPKQAIQA